LVVLVLVVLLSLFLLFWWGCGDGRAVRKVHRPSEEVREFLLLCLHLFCLLVGGPYTLGDSTTL